MRSWKGEAESAWPGKAGRFGAEASSSCPRSRSTGSIPSRRPLRSSSSSLPRKVTARRPGSPDGPRPCAVHRDDSGGRPLLRRNRLAADPPPGAAGGGGGGTTAGARPGGGAARGARIRRSGRGLRDHEGEAVHPLPRPRGLVLVEERIAALASEHLDRVETRPPDDGDGGRRGASRRHPRDEAHRFPLVEDVVRGRVLLPAQAFAVEEDLRAVRAA